MRSAPGPLAASSGGVAAAELESHTEPNRNSLTLTFWFGLAYVAVTPLENLSLPVASPVQILGLLFYASWLADFLFARSQLRTPPRAFLPFVAFAIWSGLAIIWSWDPGASILVAMTNTALTVGVVACSDTFRGRLRFPIGALAVGATFTAIFVLIFGAEETNLQTQIEGVDENITSFGLAVGLAAVLYLAISSSSGSNRLVWTVCAVLDVGALFRIGSRTGLVSVVGIAAVLLLISMRSWRALVVACFAVGTGFLTFMYFLSAGLIPPRIVEFLDAPVTTDSRDEITEAFVAFKPLWEVTGVGGGADATFLGEVANWPRNVHSGFWQIWVEFGIVGLLLWLWMLVVIIVGISKLGEVKFFLLAAVPVAAFTYTLGPTRSNMLWVLFGLAVSGLVLKRHSRRSSRQFDGVVNSAGLQQGRANS